MAHETHLAEASPGWGAFGHARALVRSVPTWIPLGAVVLAVTAVNVAWLAVETRPPHWDMAHHLANSLVYLHSIGDPVPFLTGYLFYPPLAYWVTDVFYAVTGSEAMWVAAVSNVVWMAILVFSTFGIGKRLWNARVGWLSVVFVLAAPIIVSSSKEYMLDVPQTAMAARASAASAGSTRSTCRSSPATTCSWSRSPRTPAAGACTPGSRTRGASIVD